MNALAANWKTTASGVLMIAVAAVNKILLPALDGNPATLPDWEFAGMFILAGAALLFSADGSKLQELLNRLPAVKSSPASATKRSK